MLDLHIHTTASDGSHTAAEVAAMVSALKLKAFGVADHNELGSLEPAWQLAEKNRLCFFPAVELDTLYRDQDLHLLAYGIDFRARECCAWMEEIGKAKMKQTRRRVNQLKQLGFRIEYDELVRISRGKMPTGGDYVRALSSTPEGRSDPRVRNYLDGPRSDSPYMNFYLDWLKAGKPAFVPFEEMECRSVMEKTRSLKAVNVLAHPTGTPPEYVRELMAHGLQGLEIYTSYHPPEMARAWLECARKLGLLITAGSDFHGKPIKPQVNLGIECPEEKEILDRMRQALDQRGGRYLWF